MQTVRYDMAVTLTTRMTAAANASRALTHKYLELPPHCLNSRDTYPLFTSVVPPFKKQNQLLPHDLVATREQHLKSVKWRYHRVHQQNYCGIFQKAYKIAHYLKKSLFQQKSKFFEEDSLIIVSPLKKTSWTLFICTVAGTKYWELICLHMMAAVGREQ